MSSQETVIKCISVSKKYHVFDKNQFWQILVENENTETVDALKDISLEVPKGEFIGILGRNGSGKSTLLRTIGGVYSPTTGIINLSGSLSAIYELGVTHNIFLTGRYFAARWLEFVNQCKTSDSKILLEEIEEFSELGEYFDKPIFKYSSGMRARLFFAVATAIPGKIYLIDEVLSVGDEYFQAKCWQRLRSYFRNGASGILVTHDWSAVLKLCQTAYTFENGKVIDSGVSSKVVQRYLMLHPPANSEVSFSDQLSDKLYANTLKDFEMVVPINVFKFGKVYIAYSIEIFEMTVGWEHLLHLDCSLTDLSEPGSYEVILQIPDLPLGPGEYYLNLFLYYQDSASKITQEIKLADVRGWTYGNGIKLIVDKEGVKGHSVLPIKWEIKCE